MAFSRAWVKWFVVKVESFEAHHELASILGKLYLVRCLEGSKGGRRYRNTCI